MNWLLLKEPQAWAGLWNCQHREGCRQSQGWKLSLPAESPGAAQRSFSQEEVMLLILIPLLPTETGHYRNLLLLAVLPAGTGMPHFGLLQLEHTPCKPYGNKRASLPSNFFFYASLLLCFLICFIHIHKQIYWHPNLLILTRVCFNSCGIFHIPSQNKTHSPVPKLFVLPVLLNCSS